MLTIRPRRSRLGPTLRLYENIRPSIHFLTSAFQQLYHRLFEEFETIKKNVEIHFAVMAAKVSYYPQRIEKFVVTGSCNLQQLDPVSKIQMSILPLSFWPDTGNCQLV